MKLTHRHRSTLSGLNMTPMIDIVFLLIIFFMTVSQITKNVSAEVRLPEVGEAEDIDLPEPLEIAILRDGEIRLDGAPSSNDAVVAWINASASKSKVAPKQLEIRLRIDRECDSQNVNAVFASLGEAGVERVFSSVLKRH